MPNVKVLAAGVVAASSVAAVVTAVRGYRPLDELGTPATRPPDFDDLRDRAARTLQRVVRIPTVSYVDEGVADGAAFDALHDALREEFPLLHERLTLTRIGDHGLLFHWAGASAAQPLVLMAHQDVVPIDDETPWQQPAFDGAVDGDVIWGRGTLDDKGALIAICEAAELLLAQDFTPAQDVYLSFGANEEVSGDCAAQAVAELSRRGVTPWLVLDEGGAVAGEAFPGVDGPVAVVGVSEKGVTDVELRVTGAGGHASMPPRMGTTARLARAISRLENHPFTRAMPEPTVQMIDRVGRHSSGAVRLALALTHGRRRLLAAAFDRLGPETSAMTRTTMAVTRLRGAPGHNVLASTATAGVNVRVMLGESVADAVAHITKVVDDDQVEVVLLSGSEPSPLSPTSGPAWEHVTGAIQTVFPEAVATPYVMMAATDSRFFTEICSNVYRFAPFRMSRVQRESIHSVDEHLHLDALAEGVWWFRELIERLPA
ncbi:M20/M25/M40 family metallo-hydrolase [Rudaeicoccus suwonensis]|uniref:Carboxypeptidase PM20D1 n=1 Tax=Rudaeicoccus suwonensis TaxID=657409 RepID=A0A561EB18_9MICO|nr:M20/M25/M40 family metallo-hydrolase [Rudaeicoccus suwonensis]TWE12796.1 carboxypeptidase PM20D1 [Rudaeicoccus suwonensis]